MKAPNKIIETILLLCFTVSLLFVVVPIALVETVWDRFSRWREK